MFNVKSQDDYNKLSWSDKLRYDAENPANKYGERERYRTQQVLYTNPTEAAHNWWSQQQYVQNGGDINKALSGDFDKSAYRWEPAAPVRQTMQSYGMKNDRIGWDGQNVTYDGNKFMKPDVVAGGTSYADEADILNAFRQYNENNDVVAARNYINSKNPNVNVGWDAQLGQILVGSQRLTPDYISPDGIGYVSRSKVDAALDAEGKSTGLRSYADIYNANRDKWDALEQRAYEGLVDREPFFYDAEKDPYYQDFKREWLKQSQANYDDTIARMNTQSGGAPSLGAMSAAWNMYQDSLGQLDSYKNQFRNDAYARWEDDYNRDVDRLNLATSMADRELQNDYAAAQYARQDLDNFYAREYQTLQNQQLRDSLALNKQLQPYEIEMAIQQVAMGTLQLTEQEYTNLILQAEANGYYNIPKKTTTQTYTPTVDLGGLNW